jgi:hypothetical protein
MLISDPYTEEDMRRYGTRWLHDIGTCPKCGYDADKADDAEFAGEQPTADVWDITFLEVLVVGDFEVTRELATGDGRSVLGGHPTGVSNTTAIYCESRCINCRHSHKSTFMGPRSYRDIARKQVEFLTMDFNKGGE